MYWTKKGGWCNLNLTQRANAPFATSPPTAFSIAYKNFEYNSHHIFYDHNGQIHELYHEPKKTPVWVYYNITKLCKAPSTIGIPASFDYNHHLQAPICCFISRDSEDHIHQFNWNWKYSKWDYFDLQSLAKQIDSYIPNNLRIQSLSPQPYSIKEVPVPVEEPKKKKKEEKEELTPTNECSICMENKINALLLPCSHAMFCFNCANGIAESSKICPICRSPVNQVLKIFL